jgi:Ca2+-binding EF-hand superfamily protein
MKKRITVTGAVIVFSATVRAADPADVFPRMDVDQSGSVSQEEYLSYYMQVFRRLDKNGDGLLATDEFPSKAAFSRCDRDGDGKLSISEYTGLYSGQFTRKDADRNGSLSPSELGSVSGS